MKPISRLSAFAPWIFLSLLVSVIGCGKPKVKIPETYDVSAVVTLKGEPLAGGIIGFQTADGDPADYTLDASGKTPPGLKFPAGTLRVRLLPKPPVEGAGGESASTPAQKVPEKYHSIESSGLTVEVKPEPNEFTIEL